MNQIGPTSPLLGYYNSIISSLAANPPTLYSHHYCVTNCMFCKTLDSFPSNFDPWCPAEVCTQYNLAPSRCLPKVPNPAIAGVSKQALTPVASSGFDLDTEYDITFAVYGVDNTAPYVGLPQALSNLEGCPLSTDTRGLDGMPVGFSFMPSYAWLKQNLNRVTVLLADGTRKNVDCAAVRPAGGVAERTVLFAGKDLGTETNPPVSIFIQGPVLMANGVFTTTTTMSSTVGAIRQGPLVVYAETYTPASPLWSSFLTPSPPFTSASVCPAATTTQIVLTTWSKGVRQFHPSIMAAPTFDRFIAQAGGVTVTLADNTVLIGGRDFTLADDDNDNYIHLCLRTTVPAATVKFERALFAGPRNTPTIEQTIAVNPPLDFYAPYPVVNAAAAVATPLNVVTKSPSVAPSTNPSNAPSVAPSTTNPSVEPTLAPSTNNPSVTPTLAPSARPSNAPTFVPTTLWPSVAPTKKKDKPKSEGSSTDEA